MKFVLVTADPEMAQAAREAFHPDHSLATFARWEEALECCEGADMMFVDMLCTLVEPHKIAGYERFAHAKMEHPTAKDVPLVLIAPPEDYELDFMTGWPDFVVAHIRRPVSAKVFERARTWV